MVIIPKNHIKGFFKEILNTFPLISGFWEDIYLVIKILEQRHLYGMYSIIFKSNPITYKSIGKEYSITKTRIFTLISEKTQNIDKLIKGYSSYHNYNFEIESITLEEITIKDHNFIRNYGKKINNE